MKLKQSILAMIAGVVLAQAPAMAGQIKINFTDAGLYNGTITPSTPVGTIWATALFEDMATAGHVQLTMKVTDALYGTQAYVNQWLFNVKNTPTINFTNTNDPTAVVTYSPNCCQVNAESGNFDLKFAFNTSSPGNLSQGADSVWEMVGTGLTAASFNDLTPHEGNLNSNKGDMLASVKVQGDGISFDVEGVLSNGVIDPQGEVPEPGTLALIGLGLLGASLTRRRSYNRRPQGQPN